MTSRSVKHASNGGVGTRSGGAPAPFPDSGLVPPEQALDVACHALEYRSPAYSAHSVLARWQRAILISVVVLFLLGLVFPGSKAQLFAYVALPMVAAGVVFGVKHARRLNENTNGA